MSGYVEEYLNGEPHRWRLKEGKDYRFVDVHVLKKVGWNVQITRFSNADVCVSSADFQTTLNSSASDSSSYRRIPMGLCILGSK